MIIDGHAHIFDRVQGLTRSGITESLPFGRVRFGNGEVIKLMPPSTVETSFPPELLLDYMDEVGVDKAVLLQAPFYGELNHYVHQAVSRWPDRFMGAAYVDPWSEEAPEVFRHVTDELGFPAIKIEMTENMGLAGLHPNARLDDQKVAWFWEESERKRLVITLDLGAIGSRAYQTAAVEKIISRHPGLRIVIAHLGQPPIGAEENGRLNQLWRDQVLLARHPHVWLDLAALPAYRADEDYPYYSVRRFIRQAVELVGSDKLLWGSDLPGLLLHATYAQLMDYVTRHCDFLSEDDRAKIMGVNALRVYGRAEATPLS